MNEIKVAPDDVLGYMTMKKYKNNETIVVLGASFNGVKDMIEHARMRMPKDGVYVGEDSQLYPCFDSEDYMYENRYFTNLVFGSSLEEIDKKLNILNQVERYGNYNKLTVELHPMAYWQGDTCHDVLLTDRDEE